MTKGAKVRGRKLIKMYNKKRDSKRNEENNLKHRKEEMEKLGLCAYVKERK